MINLVNISAGSSQFGKSAELHMRQNAKGIEKFSAQMTKLSQMRQAHNSDHDGEATDDSFTHDTGTNE